MNTNPFDLITLLRTVVESNASDLHLCVDAPPMMRVHGVLQPIGDRALTPAFIRALIDGTVSEHQKARLESEWELDLALQIEGLGRFRGNLHSCRGAWEAAFRHIPAAIPELGSLGHRKKIFELCGLQRGLVLVTGVTGSGKSTTSAAMIRHISEHRAGVIVTIEDPVEFVFQNTTGVVKQREVGSDTRSFAEALRRALRQDPDVIFVGEMRDRETVAAAITAAETGHLVIATLHTIDAPKSIDRMVDVFPGDQQPQIIAQISNALAAVLSQRLLPREDGCGRVLATELLVMNNGVRACLRDRRWEQLTGLIEIGGPDGMHTIDDELSGLYLSGAISKEEAVANARDRIRLENTYRGSHPHPGSLD